jgi:hypothetical protein
VRYIYTSGIKLDTPELKHVGGGTWMNDVPGEAVDGVYHEPFMKEYGRLGTICSMKKRNEVLHF